jgi:hypothetical protein
MKEREAYMNKGHAATIVAAALLASTTAFAQTTTAPGTTSSSTTTAGKNESPAQPVTLIGCVQKESDYRKAHNIKKGGGMNMGIGDGDEFMLINATRVSGGVPSVTTVGDCTGGSGEAIELTGPKEEQFKNFVGKRVEVSGTQKRARIDASGRPTGGSAPGGGELKLFEVEVASVREAAIATAQVERTETPAATTAPAPAPAPAVTAPPPAPEPAPTATAGRTPEPAPATTLPHTASPLPLFELASLLAFAGAYGVRRLRKS